MKTKKEAKPVKYRFPRDLGACLKAMAGLRRQQDLLAAKLAPLAAEDEALRLHLLDNFKKSELQGARGSGLALSVTKTPAPTMKDWKAFLRYAKLKGNEDLLQHSVNTPAWRERYDAGKKIPGVDVFDRVGLSVRRSA